jgi:hypothetical protein
VAGLALSLGAKLLTSTRDEKVIQVAKRPNTVGLWVLSIKEWVQNSTDDGDDLVTRTKGKHAFASLASFLRLTSASQLSIS